jgi:hypothetical protein
MSQASAETLESAARMAMAPPGEVKQLSPRARSQGAFIYAVYAAFVVMLLVGAAAAISV